MRTNSAIVAIVVLFSADCQRVARLTEEGIREFALRDAGIRPEAVGDYDVRVGQFASLDEVHRAFPSTRYLSLSKVPELKGRRFWYCMVQPKGQVRGGATEYFIDAGDGRVLRRLKNM